MKKHFLKSFALLAMLFSAITMSAKQYCHEPLTLSGGATIYLSCELISEGQYRITIEGENLKGLGGSFYKPGDVDLRKAITTKTETKIVCDIAATSAPTLYTPLYVHCPGEQNIGWPNDIDWAGTCPEPVKDNESPVMTSASVVEGSITHNSVQIAVAASDNVGVTKYVIDDKSYTATDGKITVKDLVQNTSYTLTVYAQDAAGNKSATGKDVTFTTAMPVHVCFGSAGHFDNPTKKKVFYQFTYSAGQLTIALKSLTGYNLDFAEVHIIGVGNYGMTSDGNGGYTHSLQATENSTLNMRFLYSDTEMPGNQMTAQKLDANDANIISYYVGGCEPVAIEKDVNFALASNGASATASSVGDVFVAANAIDGNSNTRWASNASDPQWLIVDFGRRRVFNTVKLDHEGAWIKTFDIAISDDGINFVPIKSIVDQTATLINNHFSQEIYLGADYTAQYVKMDGKARGTGYGYSLWEFEVYYPGTATLTSIECTASDVICKVGETLSLTSVAKDQHGNVMNDQTFTYAVIPADAGSITDNVFTATSKTGRATIVASIGGIQSDPIEIYTYGNEVAPVPTRDADDVIAFYSDTYTPAINLWGKRQWNNNTVWAENTVSENTYLHYSGGNWWGWEFGVNEGANKEGVSSGVDCSEMEYLHIDVWGFENGTIRVIPIWGGTDLVENKDLATNDRYYAVVEIKPNQWNSVDIPLATGFLPAAEVHDFSSIFQFKFAECTTTAIAIDNVYFWKPAGNLPVESVTLDKTVATIEVEDTLQLNATVLPVEAANKNVVWTSSSDAIATVVDGLVTALSAGEVTITATSEYNGEIKATCTITVEPITEKTWWGDPTTIKIEGVDVAILYSYTRNEDKTITYSVIFDNPASALRADINVNLGGYNLMHDDGTGNNTAIWTSTTTHSKGETITGFWYIAGNRINFNYIVGSSNERPNTAVTSVTLDKTSCDLLVDETVQLLATVNPGIAANKNVTWNSSNSAVAEVDANGLVTAKSAGNATITVTTADGGKTAQCVVTVSTPQVRTWWGTGEVTINGHDVDIIYSITHNLDKTLTYTVIFGDDTDMVREVNARSVEDVYHKLTGYDNVNKTASYTSTTTHSSGDEITGFFWLGGNGVDFTYVVGSVNERPSLTVESVALNHTSYNLLVNETVQLGATITPGTAANKSVTWSSNNNAVATVDENGLVTAKSSGSATITVTTVDGNKTATCTINVIATLTDVTYHASTSVKKDAAAYLGINYSITRTSDRTLRYVIKVNNSEYVDLEFNVVVNGNWKRMTYDASTNTYTYTTITTYADGDVVSGFFRQIKYGVEGRWDFNYVVGSTSTTPRTMVAFNDEDVDLSHLNNGSVYDVILKRNLVMDGDWNTLCLPFALTEGQVVDIFGEGTTLVKLEESKLLSATEIELEFVPVTYIEASTPYLIKPAQNVDAGVALEGVAINLTPNVIETDDANMIPVLKAQSFTGENNTFYLGANENLYPRPTSREIKAMRAYFQFPNLTAEQASKLRARVVVEENVETALDNVSGQKQENIKVISNGQLIIIHDGGKYNAQGVKISE